MTKEAQKAPTLTINGVEHLVADLDDETKQLLTFYKGWEARREKNLQSLAETETALRQEIFLLDAALKSLGNEIAIRVSKEPPVAPTEFD